MKHILTTLIFLAVLIFTYWFIRQTKESSYAAGYAHIKTVEELQQQAGMEPNDCDGKICKMWNVPGHSKTMEAYNQAYNDQEAVKMFRRMAK